VSLKVSDLSKGMLLAFKGSLEESWPDIKDYAETESKKALQKAVDMDPSNEKLLEELEKLAE